jgi:lysophospholipase L1-like esterase
VRRPLLGFALAVLGVAVLLAVEIRIATARAHLPSDTGFVIDARVGPSRGAPLELVVLGDSTAAGVGAPSVGESLPVLLARRVAEHLGRPVHVVGYGVSGARTADVAREQVPRLVHGGADAVVIVAGANDVTHATPPWVLREQTVEVLRAAKQAGGAPVILGGIPRFRAVPALAEPLRSVVDLAARALRAQQRSAVAAAGDGARFVDIAAEASPRFLGVPESMSADGYHPSPVGYGFWADALAPAVAEAVI